MPRKISRKNLVKKLDKIFSEYIRQKYADKKGYVKCYTCNVKKFWRGDGMQAGHMISRKSRILRWSEKNVRPQCYSCNCHFYGRQLEFALNLNREYGYDIANELLIESKKIIKQTDHDLIDLIDLYTQKIQDLKKTY